MTPAGSGTFRAVSTVAQDVTPDSTTEPPTTEPASPPARALVVLLRGYQRFISPLIPPSCRFAPSCSEYAVQAMVTHGALRGTWLTVRRLLRCGPWHPGGWDPVPPRRTAETRDRTADPSAEEND